MKTTDFIMEYKPCEEGAAFARRYETMAEVWEACPRADWLVWICGRMNIKNDKQLRLFAVWCIRNTTIVGDKTTWDLLFDGRSRNAVLVAERFANGEASAEELRAANEVLMYVAAVYMAAAYPSANFAAQSAAYPAPNTAQASQFRLMVENPFSSKRWTLGGASS